MHNASAIPCPREQARIPGRSPWLAASPGLLARRFMRPGTGLGVCLLLGLLVLAAGCARPAATRAPAAATMALIEQAEAAEQQRRYDRAHALYRQARRQAPDAPSRAAAALAHGRALIAWGMYDQAAAALAQAVRWHPGDAGAWHDLGMVRHHLGDQRGAERALRRSIAISPRDPRSRIALAALLWNQQRLAEALAAYRALAALPLPARVRAKVAWAIATLRQRIDPR